MVQIERVNVSNEGVAVISCPKCSAKRKVSVGKFQGKKHTVKPRCSCGVTFTVHLEFRRDKRKQTDLHANYNITSNGGGGGTASVTNLSKNGIGFSVSGIHDIKVGQKGLVDFVLDNRKSTRLSKEIIIKSVNNNQISCIFDANQPFEKDLEFYLQS